MDEDLRRRLREGLLDSYRPRQADGIHCACCDTSGLLLSFHAIEYSQDERLPSPRGFVPMSASFGHVSGSFPICIRCAPPCGKCGLPRETETLLEFLHELRRAGLPGRVVAGNGLCKHMSMTLLLGAMLKRMLRRGRFSKAT